MTPGTRRHGQRRRERSRRPAVPSHRVGTGSPDRARTQRGTRRASRNVELGEVRGRKPHPVSPGQLDQGRGSKGAFDVAVQLNLRQRVERCTDSLRQSVHARWFRLPAPNVEVCCRAIRSRDRARDFLYRGSSLGRSLANSTQHLRNSRGHLHGPPPYPGDGGHVKLPGDGHETARWRP